MVSSNTCGSKKKPFEWKIIENEVYIRRPFKTKPNIMSLTREVFEEVNLYARKKGRVELANNVLKMYDGTEKDGIGTFLIRQVRLNSSEAQIASQIAAILCTVGAWSCNGKLKNMEFWSNTETCWPLIKEYFCTHDGKE